MQATDAFTNPSQISPVSDQIQVMSGTPAIFSDEFASLSIWTVTRLTLDQGTGSPGAPSARAQVTAQSAFATRLLRAPSRRCA